MGERNISLIAKGEIVKDPLAHLLGISPPIVRALFDLLTTTGGGKLNDVCNDPSLQCRTDTMNAAIDGSGNLPACAGGVTPGGLQVDGAASKDLHTVAVRFNSDVSLYSAQEPNNYALSPDAAVAAAHINPTDASEVLLTVVLLADTEYDLTVTNVFRKDGSTLDPNHNSAQFTSPSAP